MKLNECLFACVLLMGSLDCQAFQTLPFHSRHVVGRITVVGHREAATARAFREEKPNHRLLDEFKTHSGEVVDPYAILKISREVDRTGVRRAYIKLSKRYHPDGFRHRDVLPGKCNDLDDVREEWERIKLSYEILSDRRTRKRYDRNEMVSDPAAAVRRATVDAVGKGMTGMGKGLFHMGAFAVQQMAGDKK